MIISLKIYLVIKVKEKRTYIELAKYASKLVYVSDYQFNHHTVVTTVHGPPRIIGIETTDQCSEVFLTWDPPHLSEESGM